MFDFLSSDPAPARRDFSKSIEKDFSGCADFESRALSAGGVSLTLFYLDGCVSAAQISRRWASLLEGGTCAVPDHFPGYIVQFITAP